MIPWGAIADVGLKLIGLLVTEKLRRDALQKQMLDFVKKFDGSILENEKLRKEYERLIKKADE